MKIEFTRSYVEDDVGRAAFVFDLIPENNEERKQLCFMAHVFYNKEKPEDRYPIFGAVLGWGKECLSLIIGGVGIKDVSILQQNCFNRQDIF